MHGLTTLYFPERSAALGLLAILVGGLGEHPGGSRSWATPNGPKRYSPAVVAFLTSRQF